MFPEAWLSHPNSTVSTATMCPCSLLSMCVTLLQTRTRTHTHTHTHTHLLSLLFTGSAGRTQPLIVQFVQQSAHRHTRSLSAGTQGYRSAVLWDPGLTWPCRTLRRNCAVQSPVTRNSQTSPFLLVYCLPRNLKEVCRRLGALCCFHFDSTNLMMDTGGYSETSQVQWAAARHVTGPVLESAPFESRFHHSLS